VTNQKWFTDTSRLMPRPFFGFASADVADDPGVLDQVDTLVLADTTAPADPRGRTVRRSAYFAALRKWVEKGGNLVLTDRALHALVDMNVVRREAVSDQPVYLPYTNFADFEHPMTQGLRPNARQLVEAAPLGFGIDGVDGAGSMTTVATAAWEDAGGHTIGTTGNLEGSSDDGSRASIGELKLGQGRIRIIGGALPMPTEENDHRYGLRNYAPTYTGLFLLENSIRNDVAGLGALRPGSSVEGEPAPTAGVSAGSAIGLPSNRTCFSRRRIKVTLRDPRGRERLTRVSVRVNGKTARTLRGARLRTTLRRRGGVLVDLLGKRGRVRVTVSARTSRGRTIKRTRTYRLCVKRRAPAR